MQGNNSRLDELQAAFLAAKLPHLDRINKERRKIADKYLNGIHNDAVILPYVPGYAEPVWHIFGIRCKRRDELEKYLNLSLIHISTSIYNNFFWLSKRIICI